MENQIKAEKTEYYKSLVGKTFLSNTQNEKVKVLEFFLGIGGVETFTIRIGKASDKFEMRLGCDWFVKNHTEK